MKSFKRGCFWSCTSVLYLLVSWFDILEERRDDSTMVEISFTWLLKVFNIHLSLKKLPLPILCHLKSTSLDKFIIEFEIFSIYFLIVMVLLFQIFAVTADRVSVIWRTRYVYRWASSPHQGLAWVSISSFCFSIHVFTYFSLLSHFGHWMVSK